MAKVPKNGRKKIEHEIGSKTVQIYSIIFVFHFLSGCLGRFSHGAIVRRLAAKWKFHIRRKGSQQIYINVKKELTTGKIKYVFTFHRCNFLFIAIDFVIVCLFTVGSFFDMKPMWHRHLNFV